MKALSIRQPWAWAILHAGKRIENRSWATSFCGPVLIHAARGCTREEHARFLEFYRSLAAREPGLPHSAAVPSPEQLERGGIVGRATIVNCVAASTSPWFSGPFGLVLEDVEPLPFRPMRGALGFFEVDAPEAGDLLTPSAGD